MYKLNNHRRFLCAAVVILCIIMIVFLYFEKNNLFEQKTINVLELSTKTRYQLGASVFNLSNFPEPTIRLISIFPSGKKAFIVFRSSIRQSLFFASDDRCETWFTGVSQWMSDMDQWIKTAKETGQEEVKLFIGSNLKQGSHDRGINEPLMSRIDNRILYDCPYDNCIEELRISNNAGISWIKSNPVLSDNSDISEMHLLTTGLHSANRLYAVMQIRNEYGILEKRVAVSNDNGRYFDLLPWEVRNVAESWADPLVLYGEIYIPYSRVFANIRGQLSPKSVKSVQYEQICDKPWLAVSKDAGKTWELAAGSREIYQELYEGKTTIGNARPEIRSWQEYPDDRKFFYTGPEVMQIESDPKHPEWIYVLTYKGLYISKNMGETFKLVNLMPGWIRSVDRIAVDPLDGRYLYATVDMGKIYRSSDYGCSWELMPLPHFTN